VPLSADEEVVAVSSAMRAVLRQAEAYAAFPEAVLIRGETGTGKELVARRIHALSSRRNRPFVAVNCAAIPATLFEREFFGHRKGAYSGADDDTPGFVALADGGTLFLDEVGELPWELQPKLLRLLQDGTYTRLGDPRERRVDVRLLAATNANLDRLAEAGRFRQDLNYRLKVLELELPPLRERPDDIVPLLDHFLTRFSGKPASTWTYFGESSIRALQQYSWPGNVREILMVARRAHIGLATEDRVNVQIATNGVSLTLTGPGADTARGPATRRRVLAALADSGGNKAEAARRLGVSRQTLYRWLTRLSISTD
jgi:transcriptional regulator with PAS, ATPase and Fis domain